FNRRSKAPSVAYVKLTLTERFPRLVVARTAKAGDGNVYLGPVASTAAAKLVIEAIESVIPLRRCTAKPAAAPIRDAPCAPAQLGVSTCPCAGAIAEADYRLLADAARTALTVDPRRVLDPLAARMAALAAAHRYEEAAATRDRASAFARAVRRQWRLDALRRTGHVRLVSAGEGGCVLRDGILEEAWADGSEPPPPSLPFDVDTDEGGRGRVGDGAGDGEGPIPPDTAEERAVVAAWIEARAARGRLVLLEADRGIAWPAIDLPRYEPIRRGTTRSPGASAA
ncbi:MAG TPA: hypothetical protein VF230_01555, partial [Acidimicrobiales bacterium]